MAESQSHDWRQYAQVRGGGARKFAATDQLEVGLNGVLVINSVESIKLDSTLGEPLEILRMPE